MFLMRDSEIKNHIDVAFFHNSFDTNLLLTSVFYAGIGAFCVLNKTEQFDKIRTLNKR